MTETSKADSALITCEQLQQDLDKPNQIILDATYFLPRQQRNVLHEFNTAHIPGAQFFDIDDIADQSASLPHTVPCAEQFALQVGSLGIDNNTRVIVYDNNHFFASARVWWMFRLFGHDNIKVLDGSMSRWHQLGFPETAKIDTPAPKTFEPRYQQSLFADLPQMIEIQKQQGRQIIDARSTDSFSGQRAQQDLDIQPGHIPGSINMPYQKLYTSEEHTLKPHDQLKQLFLDANLDLAKPMLTTCGSGVSAALLLLALYQLGIRNVPMFDGSWAEWGRQAELPKACEY